MVMAVPGAKPRTLFPYCWLTGPPAASGSLAKRNRHRHETGGPLLCSQRPQPVGNVTLSAVRSWHRLASCKPARPLVQMLCSK